MKKDRESVLCRTTSYQVFPRFQFVSCRPKTRTQGAPSARGFRPSCPVGVEVDVDVEVVVEGEAERDRQTDRWTHSHEHRKPEPGSQGTAANPPRVGSQACRRRRRRRSRRRRRRTDRQSETKTETGVAIELKVTKGCMPSLRNLKRFTCVACLRLAKNCVQWMLQVNYTSVEWMFSLELQINPLVRRFPGSCDALR